MPRWLLAAAMAVVLLIVTFSKLPGSVTSYTMIAPWEFL